MDDYFEFAKSVSQASAIKMIPDATAGIDRYQDECSARADMLDAAREADVAELAAHALEATDMQTAAALVEWFIDGILADGPVALIAHAKEGGGYFTEALHRAAKAKAADDWNTRYTK